MKLLAICGSLRQASINAALLRAARRLAPPGIDMAIFAGGIVVAIGLAFLVIQYRLAKGLKA